jgi:EmrB/QacA subfamily drug resistance transporter
MRAFEPHERGKAMGIFGFGVVLAPAIGPSLGGVLVEWFGWRSIFFVVTPFCIAAVLLARRFLSIHGPDDAPAVRHGARLDLRGLALMTVVLLTLLNGMVGLHGADPWVGYTLLAVSAATLVGFIAYQRRAAQPLMELRLFEHQAFAMGSVVAFIYGMALFGSTYLVPVFMQLALHLPPSQAGAVLLPAGLVLALTIPVAGRLVDRVAIKRIVATGLLLLAASFLLMVAVGPLTPLIWITLWAVIGRIGLGCVLPSLNLGAMRGLPDGFIPHGASTINFMRQLGGAVGISLVGIVLEWRLQAQPADPVHAFHETFVLVGAITACAVVAALRMGGGTRLAPSAP